MTRLLTTELEEHKVTVTDTQSHCVHSLGDVWKLNGKLRPITDCSRPESSCINSFMESTFVSFSYNSVDSAVQVLDPMDYMAVIDISSAYRSVNVKGRPDQILGIIMGFWVWSSLAQGPTPLLWPQVHPKYFQFHLRFHCENIKLMWRHTSDQLFGRLPRHCQ